MTQKILSIFILAGFLLYWTVTFLFTMPENYFRINFYQADALFHGALFQRWTFFAPPPQHNDRLYYVVRDEQTKKVTYTLEAIGYITKQKQEHAPFNQEQTVLDYVISNSVNGIREVYREEMEMIRFSRPDSSESFILTEARDEVLKSESALPDFNTLVNYGKLLCKKNNISSDHAEFKFMIAQKPIQRFKDRLDPTTEGKETVVFETPYMSLH